ncbi:MAG: dihydrodipicolinate synthase family protein [Desulfovibrio sp.]|jgi:4-hydroxy-tetrahydrodipicolinate synthase|nr:dihydrodipicolinate synthase family protein [Desulfovibrio sp.]
MLTGVCTAICTPFKEVTQEFDEAVYLKHIDWLLECGVHIIAACGGTGEFAHLSRQERRRIAEVTGKHINGKAKLIVQTSEVRTTDAIESARHAEDIGADCLLILPAIFEGADEDGVFRHYESIAKAVKTPIMAYNIPQSSGFDITPEYFKRLSRIPNVQYIKDSSGDLMRVEQLIMQGAKLFNGCDYFPLYALMAGAVGCFWGGSNCMPGEAVRLYNLCSAGKYAEANELWKKMKPFNTFLWNSAYNPTVKAACRYMGHDLGECRLPVLPLSADKVKAMGATLAPLKG